MSEPDYIVIRPAADLPPGFLPDRYNGRWYDRGQIPYGPSAADTPGGAIAVPTGRFEARDYDGAVAEVYEIRV